MYNTQYIHDNNSRIRENISIKYTQQREKEDRRSATRGAAKREKNQMGALVISTNQVY